MRRPHKPAHWLCRKFAVLKDRMAAQDGLDDFACQSASVIRGLLVPIMNLFPPHFEVLIQVNDGEVRVHAIGDLPFVVWQVESPDDILRYEPADNRQYDLSFYVAFGDQERQSMLHT